MFRTPAVAVNPSPSSRDHFAVLGVPRTFEIDSEVLEREYLSRAAAVHPDRVVTGTARDRREAMERATEVNEAYRTLRDPVRRAEYLVKLGGIDLDSSDAAGGAPAMDRAFLVDMIERREAVEQARERGSLDELRAQVEDELDDVFDDAVAKLRAGDLAGAARRLVTRRYLQRLVDEMES
jgi:molecular chaperone HscB